MKPPTHRTPQRSSGKAALDDELDRRRAGKPGCDLHRFGYGHSSIVRDSAARMTWWNLVVVAAVIAMSLPLAMAPAPTTGIACARLDVARRVEPQVNVGSRSLCGLPSSANGRDAARFSAVTIGMLGRVVFFRIEPATNRSTGHYNASVEALAHRESEEPVSIFRWEGSLALPQSPLAQVGSRTDAAPATGVHRVRSSCHERDRSHRTSI